MLDMGFEPQIRQAGSRSGPLTTRAEVIKEVPEDRQTLLFTAPWPHLFTTEME